MKLSLIVPDIPDHLRGELSPPKAAVDLLIYAGKHGLPPADLKPGSRSIMVDVSPELYESFNILDRKAAPTLLGGYIQAAILHQVADSPSPVNVERSKFQNLFYEGIVGPLSTGHIVCAEGATGIGKGRVLARLGRESLNTGKGPVVIAAPSVSVLKQLIDEWFKAGYSGAGVSCVLGKQQFIDPFILKTLIEDEHSPLRTVLHDHARASVMSWVDKGCPPIPSNHTTQMIVRLSPYVAALEADLLALAPELEEFTEYFKLSESSDPASIGLQAYMKMRDDAMDAGILFCTHAMLAYDILNRKAGRIGVLPEYKTLLVDEAHLLERNIAGINSHSVSILGLKNALSSSKAGNQSSRDRCMNLCARLMGMSSAIDMDRHKVYYPSDFKEGGKRQVSNQEKDVFDTVRVLRDELAGMMKKSRAKDSRIAIMLGALHKVVTCSFGELYAGAMVMSNTPVRKWPVFTAGKKNVNHEMKMIWDQVNGAVLVSATLSVPSGRTGDDSINRGYIYELLNIPAERVFAPSPVIPEWVMQSAVLHMVPEAKAMKFTHPDAREAKLADAPDVFKSAKIVWQKQIAAELSKITSSSTGGTLVLCCSYEDVEGIGKSINTESGRVLLKSAQSSLEKQKEQFKEMARKGLRPIWLATGNAWTGLDLRDESAPDEMPEKDSILTDLVIPRINFSDNQTISNLLRQKRNAGGSNFTEAAFTLRQGLGRLIRRPGLQNRRIWFLDGRVWHKGPQYNVFRKILGAYQPTPK